MCTTTLNGVANSGTLTLVAASTRVRASVPSKDANVWPSAERQWKKKGGDRGKVVDFPPRPDGADGWARDRRRNRQGLGRDDAGEGAARRLSPGRLRQRGALRLRH